RKVALDRARIEIAKQIRITVKEVTIDAMTATESKFESNFSVITESIVEDVLEGVRIVQEGIDKKRGIYWAVAILPRKDAIESLTRKMQIASRAAEKKINKAYERKRLGDIASALKLLLEAREKSLEEMCYDNERAIIKRPLATDKLRPVNPNLEKLEYSIEELLKGVELYKVAGDMQKIRWGNLPPEPLVVKVLYNEKPVPEFPIRWYFRAGDGILEENSVTDKNGIAKSVIHFIDWTSPPSLLISAVPDIEKLSKGIASRNFINELSILIKSRAVDFKIIVSGFSSLSMVAEALIQKLEKRITQDSLCLYIGEFTTNDKSINGDFTRYFKNKIKEGIISRSRFKVLSPSSSINILKGHCWILNDMVDINLEIQDPKGNPISMASVSIPVDEIERLLPPLKLKLWTDRGKNLICKEDERINFYLRSNRDCYVSIFDLIHGDKIKKFVLNYWISGDKVYKFIDFNLLYGVNTIKVLGNKEPLDIDINKVLASKLSATSLLSRLGKTEKEGSHKYQEAHTTITKLGVEKEKTSFTPDLKLDLWTERGKNPTYREDEPINFYLKASKGCYVYFFGFTSNGNVLKLAANQSNLGYWIDGNKVYKFQFDFTPPIGVNIIRVFASENPLDIKLCISNSAAKITISMRTASAGTVKGKKCKQHLIRAAWPYGKESTPVYSDATTTVTVIGNDNSKK
ncbi:MAG TPA: DUF4384 domain-containing protein, partial [bacterium (Candidatus Stahlbacteria)]|nr:DUF4384 domain-containing protein [Candidatus Stahlbacteria bacterium]